MEGMNKFTLLNAAIRILFPKVYPMKKMGTRIRNFSPQVKSYLPLFISPEVVV